MKIKITQKHPYVYNMVSYAQGSEIEVEENEAAWLIDDDRALKVESLKTGGDNPPLTEEDKLRLKAEREAKILAAVKKLTDGKAADFIPTCTDIKNEAGVSGNVTSAEREAALQTLESGD